MRKSIVWGIPTAVVLTALALDRPLNIIPQARAGSLTESDSEAQCPRGDATVRGAYMSKGGGTIIVSPIAFIAFIGTVYLDGNGGVINPFTVSFNGSIARHKVPGTYTINSDCSGTMSLGGGANNFDIRVSPDGNQINYIETDAGTVVSGSASRVRDTDSD